MPVLRVVPDRPLRFAVAVRVSQVRGRGGESFHSPQVQEDAARRAVEQIGGLVDETVGERGVFVDLDVSGAVAPSSRPGLGQALQLVRDGRLDGVAVYDVSRWSRDTVGGLRELEDIAAAGGQVISAAETIDLHTPSGLFTTTVMLAAARMKRDETAKKWREVHERRHEQGQFHARVPLGYLIENGQAIVDPVLGPLVAQAFRDYLSGAMTQRAIAARLTAARGRLVRQGTVSNLLRNPFHAGQVMYRRERRPGAHTPLVDVATFDAVQRKLARDLRDTPRRRGPVSGLSGLVCCEECGKPLVRRGRGREDKDGRPQPRFRCLTADCAGPGAPLLEEVEQAVLARVLADAAGLRDDTPARLRRKAKAQQVKADGARLAKQAQVLRKQLDTALEKLTTGVIDDEDYRRLRRALTDRLQGVEQLLDDVLDAPAAPQPAELASAAERIQLRWGRMTAGEQRATLGLFYERVWLRRASYRGEPMAARLRYPD